jgi:hypothetical protein
MLINIFLKKLIAEQMNWTGNSQKRKYKWAINT